MMMWPFLLLTSSLFYIVHSGAPIYGFMDLFRPDFEQQQGALWSENPSFLGFEVGPGALVALDELGKKNARGDLELLTAWDIERTEWDKAQTRKNLSTIIECGDEWKTERCLENLRSTGRQPTLIIGSHKDLASQTSSLHSFINSGLFVYCSADISSSAVVSGPTKDSKGLLNTVRMDNSVFSGNVQAFLKHYGWTQHLFIISGVFQADYRSEAVWDDDTLNLVDTSSQKKRVRFYPFSFMEIKDGNTDPFREDARKERTGLYEEIFKGTAIKHHARIVLLFGSQRMVRDMMLEAYDAGMMEKNEYVFIIIPTNYFPLYNWTSVPDNVYYDLSQKERDEDARKAFQSAFIVTAEVDTKLFDNFTEKVKERAKDAPFEYEFTEGREVPLYAANYHDAVLLWSYAVEHHYNATDSTIDVPKLYNRTYTKEDFHGIEPVTGNIKLNEFGDRDNSFVFWHLDQNSQWEQVGRFANGEYTVLKAENEIAWPNGGKSAPPYEPVCGFRNEKCPDRTSLVIGVSVGVSALLVLVAGLFVMTHMYRKARFEAALSAMSWKIPTSEMRDIGRDPLGSSVFGSRKSSLGTRSSLNSNPSNLKKPTCQFFSKRAQYQNKVVALKTILPQYFTVNRELMIEMKTLKELRNENVLTVYGAIIDHDVCYLVTEYCNKGSLQDLLENDDVKLDDMLKYSLINDLAKGMRFLHSSVIESHGYLKSSNCVINNHFSLKLADFSRTIFMSDMDRLSRATEEARNDRLVYRAPELLRMQMVPCKGTKEGDMYSFAIIVHEIIVRYGPFGLSNMDCDLTATEVINMVTKTDRTTPFRPEFPFTTDVKQARVAAMCRDCWSEDPLVRPTFPSLRSTLRSIGVESSGGIVGNLLSRMEKYASNLEEVVEERTAQLQCEKKRTDDLIESMLPKSVADQLRSGSVVPPEWYDCVSIYFSDIVGFTAISSLSTPQQVLEMLNDLYTLFDTCIEKYDCYKVETIGDAYMVVSGLPIRNGDRHAAQIALMSLDFLDSIRNFKIAHLPEEKLRIRIGMHSGPVVAGIVGKKMPRYCLFGDTVNTASRMESNGEALKIQMSLQSHDILNIHGGFVTESRGLVEMKGKGKVPTFWLKGVENDINLNNPRHFTDQAALLKKGSYGDQPGAGFMNIVNIYNPSEEKTHDKHLQ